MSSDINAKATGQRILPAVELIKQKGRMALVFADKDLSPWKRNRVAELYNYEGTPCWHLVDIRLKRYMYLAENSCSVMCDDSHASFKPSSVEESQLVKSKLREFREDADGNLYWCTFDGMVRGHPEIDGYRPLPGHPNTILNPAGYFSFDEGKAKLLEMQNFWNAYVGTFEDAQLVNENRQISVTEARSLLLIQLANQRNAEHSSDAPETEEDDQASENADLCEKM